MPKIALVHEYLTNFAGSEQVLLALHELYPEAPIYTAMYYPENCSQFKDADIRTSFLQKFPRFKEKLYIPLMPLAVEGYDLSDYDIVISDSHIAAKGVITKPETLHICYCHTPIRYAWSPEVDARASSSWLRRLAAHYLRLWDFLASKRVDFFIANSNYIASRIKKFYRTTSAVIYPPVDLRPFSVSQAKPEEYYVLFGRMIDYKKPELVVAAFNKLNKPLKVIGRGPMIPLLKDIAGPKIEIITDYLPYHELAEIFAKASALVFPAEEDFGIAMVEMMAAGRPVIAYDAGGAKEIVTPGKTGELFKEQTIESIQEAVAKFDPLRYDTDVIRRFAEKFNRARFKTEMQSFVEQSYKKFHSKSK